jgi:PST family polysaccharide transporter
MSRTRNINFFKKIIFIITDISIIFLIPILYLNEPLLRLVFNVQSEMLSKMFIIIFSGSIFGIISTLLGYPLLAAFGYVKYANNSLIYASIIYAISITIFAMVFHNIYLVSFSIVVYAFVGLVFRLYYVYKTKILQ